MDLCLLKSQQRSLCFWFEFLVIFVRDLLQSSWFRCIGVACRRNLLVWVFLKLHFPHNISQSLFKSGWLEDTMSFGISIKHLLLLCCGLFSMQFSVNLSLDFMLLLSQDSQRQITSGFI